MIVPSESEDPVPSNVQVGAGGGNEATAGTFVYEAPGEAHTLVAHESPEPMRVHFNVTGPLIWLDENGEPNGTFDAYDYLELAREHYEKTGLGAEAVNKLLR